MSCRLALSAGLIIYLVGASTAAMAQVTNGYYGRTLLVVKSTNGKPSVTPEAPPAPAPTYVAGMWSNWSSTCSDTAVRTRAVTCMAGSVPVDNIQCQGQNRPTASEVTAISSGCRYAWKTSEWSQSTSTCSPVAIRTRSVVCENQNQVVASDSKCAAPKPITADAGPNYSGCSYNWETVWSPYDSQCSTSAKRTSAAQCLRSDGEIVDDSFCMGGKPAPATETKAIYDQCGYEWRYKDASLSKRWCDGTIAFNVTHQCYRLGVGSASDVTCTSGGAGTNPGTKTISVPCQIVSGIEYTTMPKIGVNVSDWTNMDWTYVDGALTPEESREMALAHCRKTFSYETTKTSSCYMQNWYNASTDTTLLGMGFNGGGRRPSTSGFKQVSSGETKPANMVVSVDTGPIIDRGIQNLSIASCKGTVNLTTPAGLIFASSLQCTN